MFDIGFQQMLQETDVELAKFLMLLGEFLKNTIICNDFCLIF